VCVCVATGSVKASLRLCSRCVKAVLPFHRGSIKALSRLLASLYSRPPTLVPLLRPLSY
jgi:hypothetical protein